MRNWIIFGSLLTLLVGNTGCSSLATMGGAAAGSEIGNVVGKGDPAAIIVGGVIGAGITSAVAEEAEKKKARDLARAFEEGRRYEREIQAQNEWYKATLEPEDPNWVMGGGGEVTAKHIKTQAPAQSIGGVRFGERTQIENILP